MKIRTGFVSNSSSQSFSIELRYFNAEQLYRTLNFVSEVEDIIEHGTEDFGFDKQLPDLSYYNDGFWKIEVRDGAVYFKTDMNNFDMIEYLEYLGVDTNKIEWES